MGLSTKWLIPRADSQAVCHDASFFLAGVGVIPDSLVGNSLETLEHHYGDRKPLLNLVGGLEHFGTFFPYIGNNHPT